MNKHNENGQDAKSPCTFIDYAIARRAKQPQRELTPDDHCDLLDYLSEIRAEREATEAQA